MLEILAYIAVFVAVVWILVRLTLRAPTHSHFDMPTGRLMREAASAENAELLRRLDAMNDEVGDQPYKDRTAIGRQILDEGIVGAPVEADELGVEIRAVDADGVPAEWVLAPGSDPAKRLLYIHGGGFFIGSAKSARMISAAFAHKAGVAVLAVDYRLMPENGRHDSIDDCRTAYDYMLANGPEGAGDAAKVYMSGDSAGGNLALSLAAWARDTDRRQADAIVAFAPSTDSNLEARSYKTNIATDHVLGSSLGPYARLPVTLRALFACVMSRINPRNPVVSPLYGDLGGLPATLIQASTHEMLRDDSRRYANKATIQGSPVTLQEWPDMVHVFQMFGHIIPEADEALDIAARFLADPDTLIEKT